MPTSESFDLDHTRVQAPYVRLAGQLAGPRGDVISKYDLRLVQPNKAEIPTAPLHTIEHLLAGILREELDATVIDASPMGCRTGFYLTLLGELPETQIAAALARSLQRVAGWTGEIPGCSELSCGNWRDHSLPGARAWAQAVLENPIIVQPTIRIRH
jgi:S-ribosylhomocysteine lyase